jgi:hypothetical protein
LLDVWQSAALFKKGQAHGLGATVVSGGRR